MNMPAHAFSMQAPRTLAFGSIFRFRESWALLVNNQQGAGEPMPAYIMLQGERVGTLSNVTAGMPPCLTLASPFEWFPTIAAFALQDEEAFETASLSFTEAGPVIIGGIFDSSGDSSSFSSDLRGTFVGLAESSPGSRISRWNGELCYSARPYLSLGCLFEVDRRQRRGRT